MPTVAHSDVESNRTNQTTTCQSQIRTLNWVFLRYCPKEKRVLNRSVLADCINTLFELQAECFRQNGLLVFCLGLGHSVAMNAWMANDQPLILTQVGQQQTDLFPYAEQ